jgi:hypothetical protein
MACKLCESKRESLVRGVPFLLLLGLDDDQLLDLGGARERLTRLRALPTLVDETGGCGGEEDGGADCELELRVVDAEFHVGPFRGCHYRVCNSRDSAKKGKGSEEPPP